MKNLLSNMQTRDQFVLNVNKDICVHIVTQVCVITNVYVHFLWNFILQQ